MTITSLDDALLVDELLTAIVLRDKARIRDLSVEVDRRGLYTYALTKARARVQQDRKRGVHR